MRSQTRAQKTFATQILIVAIEGKLNVLHKEIEILVCVRFETIHVNCFIISCEIVTVQMVQRAHSIMSIIIRKGAPSRRYEIRI